MQDESQLPGLEKLDRCELEKMAGSFWNLYGSARQEIKIVQERAARAEKSECNLQKERIDMLCEIRRLEREYLKLTKKLSRLNDLLDTLTQIRPN